MQEKLARLKFDNKSNGKKGKMRMNQNKNILDKRLKDVLSASGTERGKLARYPAVKPELISECGNGGSTE